MKSPIACRDMFLGRALIPTTYGSIVEPQTCWINLCKNAIRM